MLDSSQLAHFRERQAVSLMDTCHRLVHSYSTNDYNEAVSSWTESNTDISCGLDMRSGSERQRSNSVLTEYDATIRLALSEVWDVKDRIKIIKRFGETITAITFEIVSPIQRGPSGIRLLLRKINV